MMISKYISYSTDILTKVSLIVYQTLYSTKNGGEKPIKPVLGGLMQENSKNNILKIM